MVKLAIDLGSSVTKIYRADAGSGIVLAEPSCVAVSSPDREVKAIGKDAKKLVGKTAEYTEIVFPVYEGEIADMRLAVVMLKEFLSRIGIRAGRAFALFSVPCGASAELIADYAALAEECGLKRLCFVEASYLAALGADAVLSESNPVFCLDIDGGNNMDANIIDRIEKCKGLHIGALTAERVKNEIGSLATGARGTTVAEGSLVGAMRPGSASVRAEEIEPCIRTYIDKILEYAMLVLEKLPAEVAAAVNGNGVYLSGGVARIYRQKAGHAGACLRRTAVRGGHGRRRRRAGRTPDEQDLPHGGMTFYRLVFAGCGGTGFGGRKRHKYFL